MFWGENFDGNETKTSGVIVTLTTTKCVESSTCELYSGYALVLPILKQIIFLLTLFYALGIRELFIWFANENKCGMKIANRIFLMEYVCFFSSNVRVIEYY